MTIAEVSKKYDISADTLRYYERIGLLPPIPRTKSGIRDYDEDSCRWIELMKCMRSVIPTRRQHLGGSKKPADWAEKAAD